MNYSDGARRRFRRVCMKQVRYELPKSRHVEDERLIKEL